MERVYRNINYLFVLILLFAFLGFYKTYFGLFPHFNGVPLMAHLHAFGFLSWFALLIVQPVLIRKGQLEIHRTLGKVSYFLVAFIVFTVIGMISETYHTRGLPWLIGSQLPNLYVAVLGLSQFLLFYVLAISYQHRRDYHMRYIIATSLVLAPPALGRFFGLMLHLGVAGGIATSMIECGILIALIVYDKVKLGKVHPAYWITLGVVLAATVSVPSLPPTHLWQSIALGIGRLVG